jgi:hypothetical protein
LACGPLFAQQASQTFEFADGGSVVGRLVVPKDTHLQVALESAGETPVYTNILWARLSQKTLERLASDRTAGPFARIFLDPPAQARPAAKPKAITLQPVPRLDRPQGGGLFSSGVMIVLLLIVYAANVYAGWEIGIFRQWPAAMTAAVAAFVPILGPAIFLAMPTRRQRVEEVPVEVPVVEEVAPVVEEAPVQVEAQPAQPALPQPVVYARGQFTFNRRFFETKFAGFLKMVPGDAERDKVIYIKSARGEYTGHRFSKVEPNEVYLQIRKGTATEDVMLPFNEIFEVTIKHKDT